MLKRIHLNGHTIGLRSQNCVIPENIHTPRRGQRKFRGEGAPEGGNFRGSGGGGRGFSRSFFRGLQVRLVNYQKLTVALLSKLFNNYSSSQNGL